MTITARWATPVEEKEIRKKKYNNAAEDTRFLIIRKEKEILGVGGIAVRGVVIINGTYARPGHQKEVTERVFAIAKEMAERRNKTLYVSVHEENREEQEQMKERGMKTVAILKEEKQYYLFCRPPGECQGWGEKEWAKVQEEVGKWFRYYKVIKLGGQNNGK